MTAAWSLERFAWLSIAAAVVTIALESGAYLLTDVWTSAGVVVGIGARVVPNATILTHLEASGDPASWDDMALDRADRQP